MNQLSLSKAHIYSEQDMKKGKREFPSPTASNVVGISARLIVWVLEYQSVFYHVVLQFSNYHTRIMNGHSFDNNV